MTHPMLERCARAAFETHWRGKYADWQTKWSAEPQSERERWIETQRAAFSVLREPDEGMIEAVDRQLEMDGFYVENSTRRTIQLAIDHILTEGK